MRRGAARRGAGEQCLFVAVALVAALAGRGVKIGVATSVTRESWEAAEVCARARNPLDALSEAQPEMPGESGC